MACEPHLTTGESDSKLFPSGAINHSLSVPGTSDNNDDGELHQLVRNFSVTSKGAVNRGDSVRRPSKTRSSASLCSTPTSTAGDTFFPTPAESESASAVASCSSASQDSPPLPDKYKVWLMGSNGVGKTAIKTQFMTSEYICQYGNWNDDSANKSIAVSLDGEETEVEIIECSPADEKNRSKESLPDAFIIVYSVTNKRSYIQARQILSRLEMTFDTKAAILVANKTDLARLRTVSTVEGRSLAKERGCKFVETSVAINHQVDELLVGIVTQIRIKAKMAEKNGCRKHRSSEKSQKKKKKDDSQNSSRKATCIIKRLWRRTCMTSKSCDNLHAL